jgi:hypothetical protein
MEAQRYFCVCARYVHMSTKGTEAEMKGITVFFVLACPLITDRSSSPRYAAKTVRRPDNAADECF